MTKKSINFNLSEISDGAVQEKLDREMKRVAANILDPNTEAKKKRKITLTMSFSPNDNRTVIDVDTEVKSVIAPQVAVPTTMMTGRNLDTGEIAINELKSGTPGQTYIDDDGTVKTDTGTPVEEVEPDLKKDADSQSDASAGKSAEIIDYQKRQQN
ncbi:replication terminator protein [Lactobacillus plantarum]|uniref:replication terminator protein n=1 Tax=Lactiplantibacillus plantarum TaxID=1590 RepID=UPI00143D63A2|nr:replication terminator protein [Lactiplantibacillus plantarum]MBE1727418.1 replication terminator protein [Lactiplantibacillus plantarum]NKI39433.1 replication terminator protein [Lactiplantibacillus plantarum]